MTVEEIKLMDDNLTGKNNENNLVDEITRTEVLKWFHDNGYSNEKIEYFFNDKKLMPQEQEEINEVLWKCKIEKGIDIYKILVYLTDYIATPKKLMNILDEENIYIVKKELSKKYNIKIEENILKELL